MKNNSLHNRQLGLTLIEIMIAMVLGIFLLTGVVQIFISSQKNYRMQENLSRMQESGRFAMDFLTRDLRMLGVQGCLTGTPNYIATPTAPAALSLLESGGNLIKLTGGDDMVDDWNSIACGVGDDCIEDTDTISYHYGQYCANLGMDMAATTSDIINPVGSSCKIEANDLLLISSCGAADIFVATSAAPILAGPLPTTALQTIEHTAPENITAALGIPGAPYDTNAQVFKLLTSTFFIRKGANERPALWKMNNAKEENTNSLDAIPDNPIELIEGIENMQILYGSDTDGDDTPDYYVPAGTASLDMDTVVSIRVSLLAATFGDGLTSEPRDYTYNGVTITPTDLRLRRVFSSTMTIRNRLP